MLVMREAEVQRLWASGAFRGSRLHTRNGEHFDVIYEGRRGAGAGPDFRDAVLVDGAGTPRYGDIEIHLRAANWRAHGHDRDHRYDAVALHVVLTAGEACETALAGGATAALAVLDATTFGDLAATHAEAAPRIWPCHALAEQVGTGSMRALLRDCGVRRLDERAARFADEIERAERLHSGGPSALWSAAERVLWAALAEGLAYGRDRGPLRDAGMRLAFGSATEAHTAASATLPALERKRLDGLAQLLARWRATGPWPPLRAAIASGTPREASACLTRALCVSDGAISPGRARILVANVVLPFAAAHARLSGDAAAAARIGAVYASLAAPPSNTITRLLARQFGMSRLPTGAAAHMGLQHIWTSHCRQKLCATCPCARR